MHPQRALRSFLHLERLLAHLLLGHLALAAGLAQLARAAALRLTTLRLSLRRGLRREVVSSDKWPPLLKELGAAKTLGTLIEGESLLNDGSAVVAFSWVRNAIGYTSATTPPSCRTACAPHSTSCTRPCAMQCATAHGSIIRTGTPAAQSGKRYCIDGAALVFEPADGAP